MPVDVRPLRADEVARLTSALGQPRFFNEHFQRQSLGAGVILVAWDGPQPIGDVWVLYPPVDDVPVREKLPGVPMLVHLEVLPGRQNNGIGTEIVEAAQQHCVQRGFDSLALAVGTDNPEAQRLYERLGFVDWNAGEITVGWEHPLPNGSLVPVSLPCNVLVRPITPGVPALSAWQAIHPRELPALFGDCPVPWAVAGGWAIDLFAGGQRRDHEDTEAAVPRRQFELVRPYLEARHRLFWAQYGRMTPLRPGEEPPDPWHQVWLTDGIAWKLDVFLEPGDGYTWISHRDERMTMPLDRAIRRTPDGIPYLAPEAVLFAKAKRVEPKDEADFAVALPLLDTAAREWLRDALMTVYPDHPWVAAVG